MNKLYYLGKPADGFGWGIANTNLVKALSKLCEVEVCDGKEKFDAPVFSPVTGELKPLFPHWNGPRNIGYCFTEWPLPDDAKRNARFFDTMFCGSEWNTIRCRAAGVKNAKTLQQGVDFDLFKPEPPSDRKGFVVFSGGKYEFRKGQDYVLAAMKTFMNHHTDAVLLCAWNNPWPETKKSMDRSWLIDPKNIWDGFDMSRVMELPPVPNAATNQIYKLAHVGLFPNRCEAGTNLVMSEFMACARPVIATYAHGHRDVLSGDGPYHLTNGSLDFAGWINPNVSDILYYLETAYAEWKNGTLHNRGEACRKLIEPFTWERCAMKIYDAAFA